MPKLENAQKQMGWEITYNKQQWISGNMEDNYFFVIKILILCEWTSFPIVKPIYLGFVIVCCSSCNITKPISCGLCGFPTM